MTQNFYRVNLQGQSFKSQDLTGADFRQADIRGADFSEAILVGANFSDALAGLSPQQKKKFFLSAILQMYKYYVYFLWPSSFVLIMFWGFGGGSELGFPIYDVPIYHVALPCTVICIGLGFLFILKSREKWAAIVLICTLITISAIAIAGSWALAGSIIIPFVAIHTLVTLLGVFTSLTASYADDWTFPAKISTLGCLLQLSSLIGLWWLGWFGQYAWLWCATLTFILKDYAIDAFLPLTLLSNNVKRWKLWGYIFALPVVLFIPIIVFFPLTSTDTTRVAGAVAKAIVLIMVVTFVVVRGFYQTRKVRQVSIDSYNYPKSTMVLIPEGCTSFRQANLIDTNFTGAILDCTDFQGAIVNNNGLEVFQQLNECGCNEYPKPRHSRVIPLLPVTVTKLVVIAPLLLAILIIASFLNASYVLGSGISIFDNPHVNIVTQLQKNHSLQKVLIPKPSDFEYVESERFKNSLDYRPHLAFSPDSQQFIASSIGGSNILWDLKTERSTPIRTFGQVIKQPSDIELLLVRSDYQVLSYTKDGLIKLWNLKTGQLSRTITQFRDEARNSKDHVNNFKFIISANGQNIALRAPSPDPKMISKVIKVWNIDTGKLQRTFSDKWFNEPLALSPDGQMLVTFGRKLQFWDLKTGQLLHSLGLPTNKVESFSRSYYDYAQISTNNHTAVIRRIRIDDNHNKPNFSDKDKYFFDLWDLKTEQLLCTIPLSGREDLNSRSINISPDGSILTFKINSVKPDYSDYSEKIEVWNVRTGKLLWDTKNARTIGSLVLSPDGHLLAIGKDKAIKIWKLPSHS